MSYQSILRLHVNATVNPSDWESFKQMISENQLIVAKEESGLVLTYECYYNPQTFECLLIETFASEEALLGHVLLIGPASQKYKIDWTIHRLELSGPFSEKMIKALTDGRSIETVSHFEASLRR